MAFFISKGRLSPELMESISFLWAASLAVYIVPEIKTSSPDFKFDII